MKKILSIFIIAIIICSGFITVVSSDKDIKEIYSNNVLFYYQPYVQWNKTFGGKSLDWGWSVEQTNDGCYIITGETTSFGSGGYDAWLIKTDQYGNELFNKTFGGKAKDGGRTVTQTNDNGYIIGGYADSFGYPGHDFWLIKTDSFGIEQWNKTYGGVYSDAGYSIKQTSDSGFVLVGYTYTFSKGSKDIWLIKTDNTGNIEYNVSYGGIGSDHGMSIQNTVDGGYVIAGFSSSFGGVDDDGWIIKTKSCGEEIWNKTLGGLNDDWFGSVYQTDDQGFIVTGDTKSFGNGGYDVWLIKLDLNGNELWNKTFGDMGSDETGYCVKQTMDGGFIISGTKTSLQTGLSNIFVIKTNQNGSMIWNMTIGGESDDFCYYIDQTSDNGFILTGYTKSFGSGGLDLWLIKLSSKLNNNPPNSLSINGPKFGISGELYEYEFNCFDPEGDDVSYYIKWGTPSCPVIYGPYPSSHPIKIGFVWGRNGIYNITFKAVDIYGAESNMSSFRVVMPKIKSLNNINPWLFRLIQIFPFLEPLF